MKFSLDASCKNPSRKDVQKLKMHTVWEGTQQEENIPTNHVLAQQQRRQIQGKNLPDAYFRVRMRIDSEFSKNECWSLLISGKKDPERSCCIQTGELILNRRTCRLKVSVHFR